MMRDANHPSAQLRFLQQLLDGQARIAGDVLELEAGTWALHGSIPTDGEVLVAEFDSLDEARTVLARLAPPLSVR